MKILIVDDHPTNLKLLRAQLEAQGHTVLQAADGVEALEALESQPVDAVISDILMPRMDGYRLCSAVRKNERWRTLPFIFHCATHTSAADQRLAADLGADKFLKKPASSAEIMAALTELTRPASQQSAEPKLTLPETGSLNEYSEWLVAKLEAKNVELARNAEEVRSAHEQCRLLLAASPVVIYSRKVEGQTVVHFSISENVERMTGFTAGEVLEPNWWVERLHADDRERMLAPLPSMAVEEKSSDEYRLRHKNGSLLWVLDDRRLARDAQGRPAQIIGSWADITKRKAAEEDLRESEERFRQLAENIQEVFWLTDPAKQKLLYISPAYELIWGRTCESLYRTPGAWAESIHPGDRSRIVEAAETKQSGGRYDETYRITRPDGGLRWIRDRAFPVRDKSGRVYRIVGTAQDITATKRVELRIEVQHAVTAALAEAAPFQETIHKILQLICRRLEWDVGGFWTLDRGAKALRCAEIWHPSSTEYLEFATVSRSVAFVIEEGLPGHVWASGQPVWIADVLQSASFQRRTAAAKLGLHTGVGFPIKLQGAVLGVLEFFSARVIPPDAELLAMFSVLGTQVGQFIERQQLEEQFRQSQKMEAVGHLAGGVAHDFNNLLTVIQGHTQLLQAAETLDAEMAEDLQQISLASERAAKLTSQLLAFSRKQVMQSRLVDLGEVLAGLLKLLRRIIGEDMVLRVEAAPSLPALQADPGMLEQVLINLAVNARDAMPKGGVLTIATTLVAIGEAEERLHPGGRPGDFVCLRVTDTGCGMTPETLARLFEPFFTTKAPGKGTGLGLATVHGIVRQHQGWVAVESRLGEGTTFKVYFPAAPRDAATAPQAPGRELAPSATPGGVETILLVEDEPAVRDLARTILERRGYRVLEAGSGAAALALWEAHADQIDLVITDMVMPDGMSGRELALRLSAQRPSLKVIYSTGYNPDPLAQDLRLEAGLNYLPKPYNPAALARIVRKRLDA